MDTSSQPHFVAVMADAYGAVLVAHELYDLGDHIEANIEANLKDSMLISPNQAAELEAWFAL